jgi:hypothetical protein
MNNVIDILFGRHVQQPQAAPPFGASPAAQQPARQPEPQPNGVSLPDQETFLRRYIDAAAAQSRANPTSLFNWLSGRQTDAARAAALVEGPTAYLRMLSALPQYQQAQEAATKGRLDNMQTEGLLQASGVGTQTQSGTDMRPLYERLGNSMQGVPQGVTPQTAPDAAPASTPVDPVAKRRDDLQRRGELYSRFPAYATSGIAMMNAARAGMEQGQIVGADGRASDAVSGAPLTGTSTEQAAVRAGAEAGARAKAEFPFELEKIEARRRAEIKTALASGRVHTVVPTNDGRIWIQYKDGTGDFAKYGEGFVGAASNSPDLKRDMTLAEQRAKTRTQREQALPKVRASIADLDAKNTKVLAAIDTLIGQDGKGGTLSGWNTGMTGAVGGAMPGVGNMMGGAYDVGQILETVKANIGFDALQAMRDNSPTGGALGQVAVKELEALQASSGSLKQGQSEEMQRSNLADLRRIILEGKQRRQAAFQDEYSDILPPPNAQQTPGGTPQGVDPSLWEIMTPAERALWQ